MRFRFSTHQPCSEKFTIFFKLIWSSLIDDTLEFCMYDAYVAVAIEFHHLLKDDHVPSDDSDDDSDIVISSDNEEPEE